jgi:glycosyltransferase involved in cell wall biosynthesis
MPARANTEMDSELEQKPNIYRPLRVLALMEAYSVTGPAKNLIEFCLGVRPRAEVSIATFRRGAGNRNDFIDAAIAAGIKVDVLSEEHVFDLRVVRQLQQVVAACGPDIIQSHNPKSHFLVRLMGLHRQLPWIAFHHGYTWPDFKMRMYNQVNRWSLPAASRVVTVCGPFASALERAGVRPERIVVRHNMVRPFQRASPETVLALRHSLGIPAEARVIFSAGRLSREKGHIDLIRALAKLRQSEPRLMFHLVLAGDGPERSNIRHACAKSDLTEFVHLVGHQRNIALYYSMADILALPSHSEGSPNVLLEAMSAGLPVVATGVGGVPEILADGELGLLIPSGDTTSMACALARLLKDQDLREHLAACGKEAALQYSPEVYCSSLLDIYKQFFTPAARQLRHEAEP